MPDSITSGQLVSEREDTRRASPIGDEDAMVVCLPQGAEGVLGAIVGHLNLASPWIDGDDEDYWNDGWHDADHASDYGSYDSGFSGSLEMGGGSYDETMRVPGAPGMYCCRPDVGYDLWHGVYSREPALWGKYSFRPLYGHAGTQEFGAGDVDTFESEVSRKRKKREQKACNAARRFARKAAERADGPVTVEKCTVQIPLALGPGSSKAYDDIAADAKRAANGEGLYWTGTRVSNALIEIQFTADPTSVLAGYDDDGLAGLAVLLGAIDGSIEGAEVVPLGDGQFGIAGPDVGNIFKKIGDAFKKTSGGKDKGEQLKKKLDKLWAKFDKINAEYEEESGSRYTPWEAAKATAAGMEVGRGGGGRGGGKGSKRPKAQKMKERMQQMQQQMQQQEPEYPQEFEPIDPYGYRGYSQPAHYTQPGSPMSVGRPQGNTMQPGSYPSPRGGRRGGLQSRQMPGGNTAMQPGGYPYPPMPYGAYPQPMMNYGRPLMAPMMGGMWSDEDGNSAEWNSTTDLITSPRWS